MYRKITGIVCLLLSGCALHPHTKQELLSSGAASPEYCVAQDRAVVEERVQSYLDHCFHPQVINVATGGTIVNTMQLKVDKTAEHTDLLVWAPTIYGEQYYLNVVISEKNPACRATMTAVGSGGIFLRIYPKLLERANGGDPWCPF